MFVAVPVCRGVGKGLALRTTIAIGLGLVDELRFAHHPVLGRGGVAIAGHAEDLSRLQPLGDAGRGITRIKTHHTDIEVEALALPIEPLQVDDAVMHIGRRHMGVGDDGMAAIDRAMIEVKEALGLAVAHHVTAVRIGAADLGFLDLRLAFLFLQRLLAMSRPLGLDRPVEIGQ